ncbi:MAG: uroporphyrinogen decarboxylase, partial [Aquificaceae bacterium]
DIEKPLKEVPNKALQGNLDPALLYANKEVIEREVAKFLQKVASHRKTLYVFNLGHGLSPDMEEEKVKFLVEVVKRFKL